MVDIELSQDLKPEIRIVGSERTPVVIIDEVIRSPDALIEHAATQAEFSTEGVQGYPGIRAALPPEYADALLPELQKLVSEIYKPPS